MSKLKVNQIEPKGSNPLSIKGDLVVSGSVTMDELKIGPVTIIGPIDPVIGPCLKNFYLSTITACGKSSNVDCYVGSNNTLTIGQNLIIGNRNKNIGNYVFGQGVNNKIISDFSHAEGSGNTVGSLAFRGQILNGNIYLNSTYGNVINFFNNSIDVIISDTHSNNVYGTIVEPININVNLSGLTYNNVSTIIHLCNLNINSLDVLIIPTNNLIPCSDTKGRPSNKIGHYSHVEGKENFSIGYYSHAEGQNTKSIGDNSHAEGLYTFSISYGSHAEGSGTTTYGVGSHAEGIQTKTYANFSHAEGLYTKSGTKVYYAMWSADTNTITYFIDRIAHPLAYQIFSYPFAFGVIHLNDSEAFCFQQLPNIVNTPSSTILTLNNTNSQNLNSNTLSFAYIIPNFDPNFNTTIVPEITDSSDVSGLYSHAEGNYTWSIGDHSHTEGENTRSYGMASHAEGIRTISVGGASHSEGYETKSYGSVSHSEGYETIAKGNYSHAEGGFTESNGTGSHAEGDRTQAEGIASHSEGFFTIANKEYSHAEGSNTRAYGEYSHTEGFRSTVGLYKLTNTSYYWGTNPLGPTLYIQGNAVSTIITDASYPSIMFDYGGGFFTSSIINIVYSSSTNQTEIILSNDPVRDLTLGPTSTSYFDSNSGGEIIGGIFTLFGDPINPSGAHAEGFNTSALGYYSHSEGNNTIAIGNFQHVSGTWNLERTSDYLFIVGNGTSNSRSNKFEVTYDDVKIHELLTIVNIPVFASNAAAITGGLTVGQVYRNGDDLKIVH